jgi:predicted HAD superfamily phosphohydrolase YqeG
MTTLVFLDLDGTLIPGNAPDVPCEKKDPFAKSKTSRAAFQASVKAVYDEASRVGETHTVSAADTAWMDFIASCYTPMHHPRSARNEYSGSDGDAPSRWKIEMFRKLMTPSVKRIVVVGDSYESEITAGRAVAAEHQIACEELLVEAPSSVDAAMETHAYIRSFLRQL